MSDQNATSGNNRVARWKRVETVFHEALGCEGVGRRKFLAEATRDDPSLKAEVSALLEAHEQGSSLFESAAFEVRDTRVDPGVDGPDVPRQIGSYRLQRVLGRGGMGVVYQAQQSNPARPVALKLLRETGWPDPSRLKLFQREIRMLARLKHPRIADIYEAGCTETGGHYFAMELVRGRALNDYVRQANPPLRTRLRLFSKICEAIVYAHQRGVIHRDLKPGNIMVTGDAPGGSGDASEIKVLDFGLARLIDGEASSTTTEVGGLMGTPAYMSPEQLRSDSRQDVDVRSDVYALGVILYELLAEQLPYGSAADPPHELARHICETAPRELGAIRKEFRGDLEAIVTATLEKERARRYQTVADLAEDIRRFLNHEPVSARRPSAWYVARRYAMRNKGRVGAVCATLLVLAAGVITSLWQAHEAKQANQFAQARLGETRQVTGFLEDMIAAVEPHAVGRRIVSALASKLDDDSMEGLESLLAELNLTDVGREVVYESILRPSGKVIDEDFADQPLVQGRLLARLGNTLAGIGDYEHAEPALERALDVLAGPLGPTHSDVLIVQRDLAVVHHKRGRRDKAERLFVDTVAVQRRVLGYDHRETLRTQSKLGQLYRDQGRFEEAEKLLLHSLEKQEQLLGTEASATLETLHLLADLHQSRGKYDEAEELYVETLSHLRGRNGWTHASTLKVAGRLGLLYATMRRLDEAEKIIPETLNAQEGLLGEGHPDTLVTMTGYAELSHYRGRYEDAERMYRRVAEAQRAHLGREHPHTLATEIDLAMVLSDRGRFSESEELFRAIIDRSQRALGDADAVTLSAWENMASMYAQRRQYQDAIDALENALEPRRKTHGGAHRKTSAATLRLAKLYGLQDRFAEAGTLLMELLEAETKALGRSHPQTLRTMLYLASTDSAAGEYEKAEQMLLEYLDTSRQAYDGNDPGLPSALLELGKVYNRSGRFDEAEPMFSEALTIMRGAFPEDDYRIGLVLHQYGVCLMGLQVYQRAEATLLDAYDNFAKSKGTGHELTVTVIRKLIDLYQTVQDRSQVEQWESKLATALELGPPNTEEP